MRNGDGFVPSARRISTAASLAAFAACFGCSGAPPARLSATGAGGAPTVAASAATQAFAASEVAYVFVDPDRRRKIEAAFPTIDRLAEAELRDNKLPGLVVGLVVDGELAYAKGFGFADVERRTKPDVDTVYRIMSNTKSLTALAVLALRDDGALGLDDPLARFLPEAAELVYPTRDAAPITLRQLLTHTSGLPRNGSFEAAFAERDVGEEEVTRSLRGFALERSPGAAFSYSNLGYRLLSLTVARASHQSMPAFLKRRLLGPLGMTASTFDVAEVPPERLATPYIGGTSGPFQVATMPRSGTFVGEGGLYSSLRDMARYVAFELAAYPPRSTPDSGPVRRSTVRESHAPQVKSDYGEYGDGWYVSDDCELGRVVSHSGAIDGYGALWTLLPESGIGFIESTNVHRGGGLGDATLRALARAGALSRRVPRGDDVTAPFDAVMPKFIAVINAYDEETMKSILVKPWTNRLPVEREELAGYHRTHGNCSGYDVIAFDSPFSARFALRCERGALEMDIRLDAADKRLSGFNGISRDLVAPTDLRAAAASLTALVDRFDERAYKKLLAPEAAESNDAARARFAKLASDHGSCKLAAFSRWTNAPRFELSCTRGDLRLFVELADKKPAAVSSFTFFDPPSNCGRD